MLSCYGFCPVTVTVDINIFRTLLSAAKKISQGSQCLTFKAGSWYNERYWCTDHSPRKSIGSLWVPVWFWRTFLIHLLSFYSVAILNLAVTLNNVAVACQTLPCEIPALNSDSDKSVCRMNTSIIVSNSSEQRVSWNLNIAKLAGRALGCGDEIVTFSVYSALSCHARAQRAGAWQGRVGRLHAGKREGLVKKICLTRFTQNWCGRWIETKILLYEEDDHGWFVCLINTTNI